MNGMISYIGLSANGLPFAKVVGFDGEIYYFDSRALKTSRMSDFQIGELVTFEYGSRNRIVEIEKTPQYKNTHIDLKEKDEFLKKVERWSIEATNENSNYFYTIKEIDKIKNGEILYVIGRKGTGKSAIVNNILKNKTSSEHAVKLSFKNFPFNLLYDCNDIDYVQPNQYITIWQLIIYRKLATMLLETEKLRKDQRTSLQKYLNSYDSKIKKLMKKIDEFSFGISVLGSGFNFGVSREYSPIPWTQQLEDFKNFFKNIELKDNYYLLFDELDEDYKDFVDTKEKSRYLSMITSLFKAIKYVKQNFVLPNNFKPIIFLRTDIYNQLTDADKNKWSEYILELEWDLNKIKEMLAYRIAKTYDEESDSTNIVFENEFKKIFTTKLISAGNRQNNKITIFSYIARSTQWRPRDFIKYIKICVAETRKRNLSEVSTEIVKAADAKFSDYLKQEIIDETFPVLPEINKIFHIFSTIRKQSFNPNLFVEEYNKEVNKGAFIDMGAENVLGILFNYNVIGNIPSMKGQYLFKYAYSDARFNLKENIIVHRGLYKTLQIF